MSTMNIEANGNVTTMVRIWPMILSRLSMNVVGVMIILFFLAL